MFYILVSRKRNFNVWGFRSTKRQPSHELRNSIIACAALDGVVVLGELRSRVGDTTQFLSPADMR